MGLQALPASGRPLTGRSPRRGTLYVIRQTRALPCDSGAWVGIQTEAGHSCVELTRPYLGVGNLDETRHPVNVY